MAIIQDLHVQLSTEALEFVQTKVSSGEFVSESDVVAEGIELLNSSRKSVRVGSERSCCRLMIA